MRRSVRTLTFLLRVIVSGMIVGLLSSTVAAQRPPEQDYLVYVVSESADKISLVRFGPKGATVERSLGTGVMPSDVDGPHGVAISPDKQFYYVSLGHGRPFGSVWKYSTRDDRVAGQVTLGLFPATMDVSPDGEFLYAVNFNLHGDMVPSSVSVVATREMLEVARVNTCTMPHGSRFNPQGTKHYSACMMDDMLVEIDTRTLKVSRHFLLTKGKEMGMQGAPPARNTHAGMQGMDTGGHGMEMPKPGDVSCSPTWAQPSTDGSSIFVACNKSSEIVEIDAAKWAVVRRIPAGAGVYNLAVTKNGRLIATNKRGQSVSVFDTKTGRELAQIPTRRKVLHGVTVSPDNRYAFVTVEGIGSEPGTVEIIDLEALKTVATVDIDPQAAGVDFLRMEKNSGR
ncbi:MAG TPA: YncE family protein [Pyrinomonadaceae bacterium]|nr:YncE family protein [Pyrinomonadaceae bacterium]